jgi:molecular chaperone DnaJ
MVIPEGTQTGKTFRLKGKGAPSIRGGAMGDQYVTVNVVTPTELNDRQKAALKEFATASNIDVKPQKKGFFDKVKDALDDL